MPFTSLLTVAPQSGADPARIGLALIAGLLFSIAFQVVLTNLGLAIGLTILQPALDSSSNGQRDRAKGESASADSADLSPSIAPGTWSDRVNQISILTGGGMLATLGTVLFSSCFLAVRLVAVDSPTVGAIAGLLVWTVYLLLLLGLSSFAINAMVDGLWTGLVGGLLTGFRQLVSAIRSARSDRSPPSFDSEQQTLDRLRQEVQSVLNAVTTDEQWVRQTQQAKLQTIVRQAVIETLRDRAVLASLPIPSADHPDSQAASTLYQTGETANHHLGPTSKAIASEGSISSTDSPAEDAADTILPASWSTAIQQFSIGHLAKQTLMRSLRHQLAQANLDLSQIDVSAIRFDQIGEQIQSLRHLFPGNGSAPRSDQSSTQELEQESEQSLEQESDQISDDWAEESPPIEAQQPLGQNGESFPAQESIAASHALHSKLQAYLRYTQPALLTKTAVREKVLKLWEQCMHPVIHSSTLPPLQADRLGAVLQSRKGLTPSEAQALLQTLQTTWSALGQDLPVSPNFQSRRAAKAIPSPPQIRVASPAPADHSSGFDRWEAALEEAFPSLSRSALSSQFAQHWQEMQNQLEELSHRLIAQWSDWNSGAAGTGVARAIETLQHHLQQVAQTQLSHLPRQLSDVALDQLTPALTAAHQEVLNGLAQVETEFQQQLLDFKQQTQAQLNAIRKTAMVAAWILLTLMVGSAVAAAAGGAIAVTGFPTVLEWIGSLASSLLSLSRR